MNSTDSMDTNAIYRGDCFDILQRYNFEDSVDLIYLDPPFFSSRYYEVIWGDGYERRAFEDRWKGGINHYTRWMRKRLERCFFALKKTGSIYLHCDWHANYKLREVMEDIFGENNFQNEVIWYYRGGGVSKKRFARRHDTILFYSKGKKWTFNADDVRVPYSQDTLERTQYKAKAFRGKRVYDSWEPDPRGKHPDDVLAVQPTMPSSKERLGYPTQKPEKLLEFIIKASSNPGDIILDPFCGCGTSLAVAQRLKRRWVGIDVSPSACKLIERRLRSLHAKVNLINMPTTPAELKKLPPFEFENWVATVYHGRVTKKTGDKGIDVWDEFNSIPIQVKRSYHVGRPVVDLFETAIKRAKRGKGRIVAFSFTKDAHEEVARAEAEENLKIELITVKEILRDERRIEFGGNSLEQWTED